MKYDFTPQEIEKLVEKAQNGDQKSFEKIFEHFFDRIFRYVSFRVNQEDSEDIVGDVFLKVVQHLDRYQPNDRAGFNAWIFRIAHNTVIDFYRKPRDIVLESDDDENIFHQIPDQALLPNELVHQSIEHKKLLEMLAQIPDQYREVLELKYLEGFDNREIAQILEKTEGNIRIMQLRALRALKERFDAL